MTIVQTIVLGDGSIEMSSWVTEWSQPVAGAVSPVVPVLVHVIDVTGLTGAAVTEVDLDVRERSVGERRDGCSRGLVVGAVGSGDDGHRLGARVASP